MRDAVNLNALKADLKREQIFHKRIRRGIYILAGIFLSFLINFISYPQQSRPSILAIFNDRTLTLSQNLLNGILFIALLFLLNL